MSAVLKVVGSSVVDQHSAQVNGNVALGQALADHLVSLVKGQSVSLREVLVKIHDLTKEGRTAFRAQLDIQLSAIKENVKALGATDVAKRAAASARVRLSECRSFSVAVDRGFNLGSVSKDNSYHAILTLARAYRESDAAAGPSLKRGRKAHTWEEKLAAYVTKTLHLTREQIDEASVLLRKMVAIPEAK